MYIGSKAETKRIYETANERWEYAVCLAKKEEFTQVSTVNGIFTSKGGKHVDYILNQIVRKLTAYIKKKKKLDVKSTTIKEQLMIFVRCDIVNPTFDSQTKDYMTTPISKFGSTCEVSDKFIDGIAKMGVMEAACALTEVKENKEKLTHNDERLTKKMKVSKFEPNWNDNTEEFIYEGQTDGKVNTLGKNNNSEEEMMKEDNGKVEKEHEIKIRNFV